MEEADSRSGAGKVQDVWDNLLCQKAAKYTKNNGLISKDHGRQLEGEPSGQIWNNLSIKRRMIIIFNNTLIF